LWILNEKSASKGAFSLSAVRSAKLLDFGLAKFDVLFGDRIIFLEGEFFGLGASVFLGHIKKTSVSTRQKLDLNRSGFSHDLIPEWARAVWQGWSARGWPAIR
jgi:hypothetical protein